MKSLTQTEAATRAALLSVQRYDIEVDLTDLPTGPVVRTVSTITFTCRTARHRRCFSCWASRAIFFFPGGTRRIYSPLTQVKVLKFI